LFLSRSLLPVVLLTKCSRPPPGHVTTPGLSPGSAQFLTGGGEMGAHMRRRDWPETSFGPPVNGYGNSEVLALCRVPDMAYLAITAPIGIHR